MSDIQKQMITQNPLVVLLGFSETSVFCKLSALSLNCKADKENVFPLLCFLSSTGVRFFPLYFRFFIPRSSISYNNTSSSRAFQHMDHVPLLLSPLKHLPFLRPLEIIGFPRMVSLLQILITNDSSPKGYLQIIPNNNL